MSTKLRDTMGGLTTSNTAMTTMGTETIARNCMLFHRRSRHPGLAWTASAPPMEEAERQGTDDLQRREASEGRAGIDDPEPPEEDGEEESADDRR